MKIAIIERIENYDGDKPFNKRYYLDIGLEKYLTNWIYYLFPLYLKRI